MYRIIALILLAFGLYATAQFCERETDGFRISRICSNLSPNPAWEVAPLPTQDLLQVAQALKQPFHYLASGGQCYAFLSADGRYVLKFFKHFRREAPWWSHLLPISKRRHRQLNERKAKLERDFNSYKLAFEELRDETGLLLIHLNKGKDFPFPVTLIDKLGIAHSICLGDKEFVLQYKAELAFSYLERMIQEQHPDAAQAAFHSILQVLLKRCLKGIFDEDPRLHRNLGFIEGKAIILDAGRLRLDPQRKEPEIYRRDLRIITKRLKTWLQEHYPELEPLLEQELEKLNA